jgi:exopolysaccharide production protein ExoQ
MPPLLALALTIVFCAYVWRRFCRGRESGGALWLPTIWIFFIASRHPAQWLEFFGLGNFLGSSYEEGSPLDAAFFLVLILSGIHVLARRRITLGSLARHNLWLVAFALYCALSILWSDFPFVAFKRWIKTLGHPVMALVIMSDPRPVEALRWVFKRVGVIMLTFSVLFVKYFPEYGRTYDGWTGQPMTVGININKNELGYCCMVFGLFFLWNLAVSRSIRDLKQRRDERLVSVGLLLMALWLLRAAQSATSLVTLAVGSAVVIGLGWRSVPKQYFGSVVVTGALLLATLELSIGIYQPTLELLGKNATLTDRTHVWADVIGMVEVPLIGTGFESFWLGSRLDLLWAKWWWRPNQAHNGYIETYINLGLIGITLMTVMLFATFRKITAALLQDLDLARLRMAFFIVIVLYNFTEASFKATHLLWTIFFLIAVRVPQLGRILDKSNLSQVASIDDQTDAPLPAESARVALPLRRPDLST